MKRNASSLVLLLAFSTMLASCYTYSFDVGRGSQTGVEVSAKNHYLIYGLAAISTSNPNELAGGAKDYNVTVTHTFVDGLINGITFGIYNPTTTIVKK